MNLVSLCPECLASKLLVDQWVGASESVSLSVHPADSKFVRLVQSVSWSAMLRGRYCWFASDVMAAVLVSTNNSPSLHKEVIFMFMQILQKIVLFCYYIDLQHGHLVSHHCQSVCQTKCAYQKSELASQSSHIGNEMCFFWEFNPSILCMLCRNKLIWLGSSD